MAPQDIKQGFSTYTQNTLDAHSEYWGALSPCKPQSATLLHKLQARNLTLFKCINALFKIEVSPDNGSYFLRADPPTHLVTT